MEEALDPRPEHDQACGDRGEDADHCLDDHAAAAGVDVGISAWHRQEHQSRGEDKDEERSLCHLVPLEGSVERVAPSLAALNEHQRQGCDPSHEHAGDVSDGFGPGERGGSLEQGFDGDARLEARELGPEAGVDPRAESDV